MALKGHIDTRRTSLRCLAVFACLLLMALASASPSTAGAAEPMQPEVTSVSPDHGPQSGGNTVVITGANFTGATAVQFGPFEAESFTINSDSKITVAVPGITSSGEGTVVNVRVVGPGGTSGQTVPYGYGPVINNMIPRRGPASGGTAVTLIGYDLEETSAVNFGSVPAESFTINPDGSITAVSPPMAPDATVVEVTTTTPEGISGTDWTPDARPANYFAYGPTITSVTPAEGPTTGGTVVTIHGTGFKSPIYRCLCGAFVYSVKFGSAALECGLPFEGADPPCSPIEFEVKSDTEIVATTPPGNGTVDVGVSTEGGSSPMTPEAQFSYTVGAPPPPPEVEPPVLQLLHCSVQAGTVGVCSGRSVDASAVDPIAGPTARLYRGKTLYAKGTARVHRSHSRLLLDPVRSLAPGRYMLVLSRPGGAGQGSHWPRREPVIVK